MNDETASPSTSESADRQSLSRTTGAADGRDENVDEEVYEGGNVDTSCPADRPPGARGDGRRQDGGFRVPERRPGVPAAAAGSRGPRRRRVGAAAVHAG